jgi:hypothetical protein
MLYIIPEKICIEAELELTGDNRAAAAEMLGLSRQSLYVKLRRYGLSDIRAWRIKRARPSIFDAYCLIPCRLDHCFCL